MLKATPVLLFAVLIIFGFSISGCDTSAQGELDKAQEMLDKAMNAGADLHASKEYERAQDLLIEASHHVRNNEIQDARAKATKAKRLAEDAMNKAQKHAEDLSRESEEVGRGF